MSHKVYKVHSTAVIHRIIVLGECRVKYSSLLQNVGNHFPVITLLVQWILCCWNSSQDDMISTFVSSYVRLMTHINTANNSDGLHNSTVLLNLCSTVACCSHCIQLSSENLCNIIKKVYECILPHVLIASVMICRVFPWTITTNM